MRFPLFVTPLSLSSRSAIGVQTKLMLEEFPDWRHLYWDASDLKTIDPRSERTETMLFARFPVLRYQPMNLPALILAKAGLSWWDHNDLRPHILARLQKRYGDEISAVYAAPCSIRDSERTKSILAALNKPFVIHLLDILDRDQLNSAAVQWLLRNAVHVLCISEPMIDYISPIRPNATILRFARKQACATAKPPQNRFIRIALIGNCRRYPEGLSLLRDTLPILKSEGITTEVVYIGPKASTRTWSSPLADDVKATGFLPSDEARDRALALCHVGFLPGPLVSPSESMLSRFSIPSRVLDFLATGLPAIASVHADSATAIYLKKIGLENCSIGRSVEQLAEKLISLADPERWRLESDICRAAFNASQQEHSDLKLWMNRAAECGAPGKMDLNQYAAV